MAPRRYRVVVDGEPFVLRSAVSSCLKDDPRFDVVLADALDGPPDDVAAHTAPSDVAQAVLIVAPDGPMTLRLRLDGDTRPVPYPGMRQLPDTLVRELDSRDTSREELNSRATEKAGTDHA